MWWRYRILQDDAHRFLVQRRPWWRFWSWDTKIEYVRGSFIPCYSLELEQAQNQLNEWHEIMLREKKRKVTYKTSRGRSLKDMGIITDA